MTGFSQRVGFVGLGIMGRHMAHNLLKAGFTVTVYNRTAAKTESLQQAGAQVAASPREVAEQANVVCSCVTGPEDVKAVALGPDGILAGMRPGGLYIDLSTIAPSVAQEVAKEFAHYGHDALDAPVSGGEAGAREGTLTIMVGGSAKAYDRAQPVLAAMGRHIYHVGGHGHGQLMKLVLNLVGGLNLIAAAEGLLLASKAGLVAEQTLEILTHSTAQSWALTALAQRVANNDFTPGFSAANRHKDFVLALEAGQSLSVPLPLTGLGTQLMRAVLAQGGGSLDQAAVFKMLQRLSDNDAPLV